MRDAVVEASLDHIREQGLTPAQVTKLIAEAPSELPRQINGEVHAAAQARIEAKGYHPSEIAQNVPSVRREFVKRFMAGRELVSLERSLSILEGVGIRCRLVIEPDESISPRRKADAPKAVYERWKPSHQSKGIYRKRREIHSLKARVLDGWADGLSRQECAELTEIELGYVHRIISVARQQGDPRASRRRAPNGSAKSEDESGPAWGLCVAGRGRPLPGTVPSGPGASLPLSCS
ncbi:hypothetical protein [Methylobacterium sp. J-068]|uniref:hypothetical protein n=1 Tax=Methylobacterium sp. J-068 TaxID=2836649 RepID=UPI001FBA6841|nr:hypothetical protein [Methylobacterium sp. J-068]MCJ2035527.1 hypothetical protein [Methylobacterium sp. J-068]